MNIPYVNLGAQHQDIKEEILQAVSDILDSGMFILGEDVENFEKQFSRLCHTSYAIGVANGTDALFLSMKALGIGQGDEVITAPNSYLASASSIALAGAKPVFADVDYHSMNISPAEIEKRITAKTKAVIPVHLTGRPAEMDAITEIARAHNLYVIEDAAQAVGALYKGKPVGSFGDLAAFSLHPLKNLAACGDAGIITTHKKEYYDYLLKARQHGLINRDETEFWSVNSRLDALQAAILNIKIKKLEEWNNRRRSIANRYIENLKEVVEVPSYNEDYFPVFHAFMIKTPQRDRLQNFLKEKGIDTKIHYPIAIHQQKAARYLGYSDADLPVTSRLVKEILSIPVYPELTDSQVDYIIEQILNFFKQ
ncbi:MAG: DegT/DnrJ/EryC1/StrS family aminotransferase [Bacteroidetes bacterium]|nr:MAG: DegT/DnrJ/EryC1/StrS family aminotransferase [Bacteroidota bacterium]